MLHGKGSYHDSEEDNQSWMTKEYQEKRAKGLTDRNKLTDEELLEYEIGTTDGTGATDETIYEVWQYPFPDDTTVRQRKKINLAAALPKTGTKD